MDWEPVPYHVGWRRRTVPNRSKSNKDGPDAYTYTIRGASAASVQLVRSMIGEQGIYLSDLHWAAEHFGLDEQETVDALGQIDGVIYADIDTDPYVTIEPPR